MRTPAPAHRSDIRILLLALLVAIAAPFALAPPADAQAPDGFGIVRNANPFLDGWTAQVFADDARLATDAYSNTGGGRHDPYPVPSTGGTGVYELAGGHPFIGVTDFTFNRVNPDGPPTGGNVAHLRVDIPRGLSPNPGQFTRCTDAELEALNCPLSSQIGTEQLTLYIQALQAPLLAAGDIVLTVPLYNMTPLSNPEDLPRQEVPARFGFHPGEAADAVLEIPEPLRSILTPLANQLVNLHSVHIVGGVRDAPNAFAPFDNGLFFTIDHLPAYDPASPTSPGVVRSNLTFWGVPGDVAGHGAEIGDSCISFENALLPDSCTATPPLPTNPPPPPDVPFLSNPTECTGTDLISRLSVWSHVNSFDQIDDATPAITDVTDGIVKHGAQGCVENVPFNPGATLDPQSGAPDSPSGAAAGITVPQPGLRDKDAFATSHVKDISVTLPPGLTINPSVANGLEACTDEQLAANTGVPGGEACPAASRIGSVAARSPSLPAVDSNAADATGVLGGSAYVGQPIAGDKYRLFVTIEGRGISIRQKGSIRLDPNSGQVTATFPNNPQLPFDDLTVDFRDGPRAPLATPLDCGPKSALAQLTPWSGTATVSTSSNPFSITGTCPPGFQPGLGGAPASPLSGATTPFTATLTRPDGSQFLSRARVQTPPGLAGNISKVEQCASAQAATGACPANSRIGTATTWAGAGSEPYRLAGPVYLTEGYKGGQFGMVTVIRAIAGPYDLGTVVVRQSIFVDPEDAHLTVVSDPFPTILDGVPIRLRRVDLSLDTPGFSFNPTSCGTKGIRATLYPVEGAAIDRTSSFGLNGCERLGFKPRMSMQLVGPRQTRFEGHPSLRTRVKAKRGHANIGRVRVALPPALALDPENSQKVCSVAAAAKADCPKATRIGFAKAISPALNKPIRGPVYFVQGVRTDPNTGRVIRTLPSLLAKLRGEIGINLRGTTDVVGRKLVSDFGRVPDAPVSDFRLNLRGGKRGPLVVSARRGICDRRQITKAAYTGHNGKRTSQRVNMRKPCRRPMVVLRKIRDAGKRLVVRGTIRPKARKRLKVSVRCGGKAVVKRARRQGRKRWGTRIALKGRCANASKAKLRVRYPGGGDFRIAVRKRNVKLNPGGS